jgi:tetratricopeptide (TPR) repeat protein
MRKFNICPSRLTCWQIFSFAALTVLAVAAVLLYHHQTEDSFVPFGSYLLSLRLAVPPIIGLFSSYFLLFMGGVTLADAPRKVLQFLRNIFFQTEWMMILVSLVSLLLSGVVFAFTASSAPPAYTQLVNQLLGAESDDGFVIEQRIKSLKVAGNDFGDHIDLVYKVFKERKARNTDGAPADGTKPRILVRALDANQIDAAWKNHPLRWHALAEAYSMWAQAAQNPAITHSSQKEATGLREKALTMYQKVVSSNDWRATDLMRFSAEQNRGNIYLYTNNLSEAEKAYKSVLAKNRNLSTSGNLMALYLMSQPPRISECEQLGLATREWALIEGKAVTEGSPYSGVLSTLGFAKLIQQCPKEGTDYLLEAYDIVPDMLNTLNLAVSLILENRHKEALKILDMKKLPHLTAESQLDLSKKQDASTFYLIRGLALSREKLPDKIAHYLFYLERPTSSIDIQKIAVEGYQHILIEALAKLRASGGSDADFLLIPGFDKLFELQKSE